MMASRTTTFGLALRFLGEDAKAYDAFYKATWNAAWRSAAYFALAEIDTSRHDWHRARDHLCRTLLAEGDHLNARTLLVFVYRQLGNHVAAAALMSATSSGNGLGARRAIALPNC